MFKIIVLGEALIDFTPCGKSTDGHNVYEENPGGAPANVIVVASRLGQKGAFIGKVGNDYHGNLLIKTLEQEGVNTQGLIKDPDYYTTLAFVSLDNGERSFSFVRNPGADTQLHKDEVNTNLIENSRIFHCGSLSLTSEPARSATLFAIKHAKETGAIISYDPNYRKLLWSSEEEAKKQMRRIIPFADIIKISDEETGLLTDKKDPVAAADELINQGVSCVLVTLGKDGALMKTKTFEVYEKGKPRNVVDTTGAGDAFCGGILSCLAQYKQRPEDLTKEEGIRVLEFANTVAGLCVEKKGAIPGLPTLAEVLNDLKDK